MTATRPHHPFAALAALAALATAPLQRRVAALLYPVGTGPADFLEPAGEPALIGPDSVSWRVFANPVAMFVGGVAAVLLELAEPRIRSGVWEHTSFRSQPLLRLQRTGYAAMMTVYGARSRSAALIARVNAGHERVRGHAPSGMAYRANDPELLAWVHATASFGFLHAYLACVEPLTPAQRDLFYAEGQAAGRLYGVAAPPGDERAVDALFERMRPQLEASAIVDEFLAIMAGVPLLPRPLRGLQRLLLRAAVQCLPAWTRATLGLAGPRWRLAHWQWALLRTAGRAAQHLRQPDWPALLARCRLEDGATA